MLDAPATQAPTERLSALTSYIMSEATPTQRPPSCQLHATSLLAQAPCTLATPLHQPADHPLQLVRLTKLLPQHLAVVPVLLAEAAYLVLCQLGRCPRLLPTAAAHGHPADGLQRLGLPPGNATTAAARSRGPRSTRPCARPHRRSCRRRTSTRTGATGSPGMSACIITTQMSAQTKLKPPRCSTPTPHVDHTHHTCSTNSAATHAQQPSHSTTPKPALQTLTRARLTQDGRASRETQLRTSGTAFPCGRGAVTCNHHPAATRVARADLPRPNCRMHRAHRVTSPAQCYIKVFHLCSKVCSSSSPPHFLFPRRSPTQPCASADVHLAKHPATSFPCSSAGRRRVSLGYQTQNCIHARMAVHSSALGHTAR